MRRKLFYGWVVLAVSVMGVLLSIPGQTIGVSVFTGDLTEVLGFSPSNLSLCYLIGTILSALMLTPVGKLLDSWGARKLGGAALILFGLHLILLSLLNRIAPYVTAIPYGGILPELIVMTLGFFLLRFFGQGVLTMTSRTMLMRWFDRYRGRVNAILGAFTAFGFSYSPKLLNTMREALGWSGTWRVIGIAIATLFAVLFILFARDSPQKCGLEPDGGKAQPGESGKRAAPGTTSRDSTLKEARRTLPFWVFSLTLTLHALFATAMSFHIIPLFAEAGMGRELAVSIFFPASFISVGISVLGSMLSDYIRIKYLLLFQLLSLGMSALFLSWLSVDGSLIPLIIGYGALSGTFAITSTLAWPRYYGSTHLGSIMGLVTGMMVAGSALGPHLFSLVKVATGGFAFASIICIGITVGILVAALFLKDPA